jgi:hypothetical protein
VIVDARSGDVRVAEPFLHLGDVGLVVERVGGGGPALVRIGTSSPSDTRVSSSAVGRFFRRASRCSKLSMSLVVVFATRAMFLSGLAGQEDYTLV